VEILSFIFGFSEKRNTPVEFNQKKIVDNRSFTKEYENNANGVHSNKNLLSQKKETPSKISPDRNGRIQTVEYHTHSLNRSKSNGSNAHIRPGNYDSDEAISQCSQSSIYSSIFEEDRLNRMNNARFVAMRRRPHHYIHEERGHCEEWEHESLSSVLGDSSMFDETYLESNFVYSSFDSSGERIEKKKINLNKNT